MELDQGAAEDAVERSNRVRRQCDPGAARANLLGAVGRPVSLQIESRGDAIRLGNCFGAKSHCHVDRPPPTPPTSLAAPLGRRPSSRCAAGLFRGQGPTRRTAQDRAGFEFVEFRSGTSRPNRRADRSSGGAGQMGCEHGERLGGAPGVLQQSGTLHERVAESTHTGKPATSSLGGFVPAGALEGVFTCASSDSATGLAFSSVTGLWAPNRRQVPGATGLADRPVTLRQAARSPFSVEVGDLLCRRRVRCHVILGPSVKDKEVYEALRDEGNSKEKVRPHCECSPPTPQDVRWASVGGSSTVIRTSGRFATTTRPGPPRSGSPADPGMKKAELVKALRHPLTPAGGLPNDLAQQAFDRWDRRPRPRTRRITLDRRAPLPPSRPQADRAAPVKPGEPPSAGRVRTGDRPWQGVARLSKCPRGLPKMGVDPAEDA